jgi:hypothetical protein
MSDVAVAQPARIALWQITDAFRGGHQQPAKRRDGRKPLPFFEADQDGLGLSMPRDDEFLAEDGFINDGGEVRLCVAELEFFHGRLDLLGPLWSYHSEARRIKDNARSSSQQLNL